MLSDGPGLHANVDFPAVDETAWRVAVDKVLAKDDTDPDALATRYARKLVTTTLDGLRIDPLYTADDVDLAGTSTYPGQAPYLRGTRALGHRRFG